MSRTRTFFIAACLLTAYQPLARGLQASNTPCSGPCVLTFHNDLARDGVTSSENILTPANVNSTGFGREAAITGLSGQIYAQPLYMSGLNSIASKGDVVFVATEQDFVYAFDADTYTPIWGGSYIPFGERPLSTGSHGDLSCPNITPNVGITATPVIDPYTTFNANPTLYVVTRSADSSHHHHQRLHAIDVTNGSELFGGPVEITTPPGSPIAFDPLHQNQRAGLLLTYDSNSNPQIYIAWGSHCDSIPYRGWIMKYSVIQGTLSATPTAYFMDVPASSNKGGIWQSGGALASDNSINGNLFFSTGNGPYDGRSAFGQTVLKLSSTLRVFDWYTPNEWRCLNGIATNSNCISDQDLGSGGVLLFNVPRGVPELVAAGKQGEIYVIYQSNLGHLDPAPPPANYNPPPTCTTGPLGGNDIAQCFLGIAKTNASAAETGSRGTPAFWNGTLYTVGSGDTLRAFSLSTTAIGTFKTTSAVASAPTSFAYPGASPVISWNGNDPNTAIVWVLQTSGYQAAKAAVLQAYAAVPSSGKLTQVFKSTSGPGAVKFVVPTVANGKVFVGGQGLSGNGTEGQLYVYGLCPCN